MSFGQREEEGVRQGILSRRELQRGRVKYRRFWGNRWQRAMLASALVLIALLAYSLQYYRSQVNGGSSGVSTTVVASQGEGLGQFAAQLVSKRVIQSALVFKIWLRLHSPVVLQPGTYRFNLESSYANVAATLGKGPIMDKLTIPDGLTLAQIAAKVGMLSGHSAQHFLEVANSGAVRSPFEPSSVNSLEGLLYPNTYVFSPSTTDASILRMMSDAFVSHAYKLGLTPQTRLDNLSAYQIITVASLVEKEASYPGDGNKVARVILNRLQVHMKLQVDSTVIYALGNDTTHLTAADLGVDSPYNTYTNYGLPPTPIAIPSESALQSAMAPAVGNWLYYVVVQKDGQEAFSSTYAGQLSNEALARSRGL